MAEIGRELHPGGDSPCDQTEIAQRLCSTFNLKPPIQETKINTFLETAGIFQQTAPGAGSTTFIHNRKMLRWEIHTRPCLHQEWSREVWHDVWEILFWRCFHCIPWWKQWAVENKFERPHDKADEFAFLMLLSSQSVPAQAKKCGYDVYEVAKYYGVPTNLAFRALSSYTKFPHPVLMAIIRLDVSPPTNTQSSLESSLFMGTEPTHALVYNKFCKDGKQLEGGKQFSDPEARYKWRLEEKAFATLSQYFRRDTVLCFEPSDPVYQYCRQEEPRLWSVHHVLGVDLSTQLCLITRQNPRNRNEIFLQIVPPGYETGFQHNLKNANSLENTLLRAEQTEWRRAARSITKGIAKRSALPASPYCESVREEKSPVDWIEAG